MRRGGTRAGKGGAAFEDAALKLPEGAIVPPEVPLTSFSILMARLDGCGYGFGGCGFGFGVGVLASHFGDLRVRGAGCAYLGVQ